MSGGVAYVFDEDGQFARRCNTEMVALEALEGDEAVQIKALVEEHLARTQSPRARELLEVWDEVLPKLVKVMPSEYRRVLSEMATMPETAGRPTGRIEHEEPRPYTPSGPWRRSPTIPPTFTVVPGGVPSGGKASHG
jgi:hypothetical protein